MTKALQFADGGVACCGNFPYIPLGTCSVLEFIFMTEEVDQVFASGGRNTVVRGFTVGGQSITVFLNKDGNICVGLYNSFARTRSAWCCVYGNDTVTDGKWHQLTLYVPDGVNNGFEDAQLYIDGQSVSRTAINSLKTDQLGVKPTYLSPAPNYGGIVFGADGFNNTPWAGGFTGAMTEIRVWGGGQAEWILTPPFSLNVFIPMDPKTPNLLAYWPFWESQTTPLVDLVDGATLTLTDGVTWVSSLPQIYDDLSDTIANGPTAPFDGFTTAALSAAFSDIMAKTRYNYTPSTLRALYTSLSNIALFSVLCVSIKNLTYADNDRYTAQDFGYVQNTLVNELTGASSLWGAYNDVSSNYGLICDQIYSAAQTVYTTAMATSIASDMNAKKKTSGNAGTIVNALAGVSSALGPTGKAVSSAIKAIWTVVSWAQAPGSPTPTLDNTLNIEATVDTLESAANQLSTSFYAGLKNSINLIAKNGGLIGAVGQRFADGVPFSLPNDVAGDSDLDALYNMSLIFMTKVLTNAAFTMWVFVDNVPGGITYQWHPYIQDTLFGMNYTAVTNPFADTAMRNNDKTLLGKAPGTFIVGYFVQDGYNGYPTCYSLLNTYDQLLNDAATKLSGQNMQPSEIANWFPITYPV